MDLAGLLAFNVLTGIATLVLITLGLGVIQERHLGHLGTSVRRA